MKIKIDGQEYPFPDIDSITLDEAIILERNAGMTLDELLPGASLPVGAVKGFVVVALIRAHPEATEKEIGKRIGKIKLGEMQELVVQEEAEESPPPQEEPSETPGSDEASGNGGDEPSEPSPAASLRLATGRLGLAHYLHLRPEDLGRLTPEQMMDAHQFMRKSSGS